MKKIYAFAMALLASTAMLVYAQSLSDTQTLWAKFVSNSINAQAMTTQGNQMLLAPDGGLYVIGQAGATSTSENITFGDEIVATGIDYSGNGANQGLLLMKLTANGDVQWTIAQTHGEVASNENWIANTSDGGVIALVNLRHSDGHLNENIAIKDGQEVEHVIEWTVEERSYRAALLKVSANGSIEWMHELVMNATADEATYPQWSQTSRNIGQGVKTYALDVDNEGNIYIGGLMCSAMTIGDVTIEPHNVSSWNGNAQNTVGNLFVIKFDSEGNYVDHLVSEGESTQESVRGLRIVGDKLYMSLWVTGLAGTEFSIGGKGITPATINSSWCLAELDVDLHVNWLKHYECTVSGSAWQMPTLVVAGDHLYLMGTAKYGIQIGETIYTNTPANKSRQSWIIQFDKATGEAQTAAVLATGKSQMQHGFFGGYEGTDGALYAIERGLTPSASFGSELILYKFNAATLAVEDQVELATGSCDGQSLVTDGTRMYVMNRFANKNENCTFYNSDITHANAAFNWGQSAFLVPVGAVQSLILDCDDEIDMSAGDTRQLAANVQPQDAMNQAIIWSSSNTSLVTVNADGLVSANALNRGADHAIVTATCASNPTVKASVMVTVSPKTAITDVVTDAPASNNNVYTIDGRLIKKGDASLNGLAAGLYIIGGKKVVVC